MDRNAKDNIESKEGVSMPWGMRGAECSVYNKLDLCDVSLCTNQ